MLKQSETLNILPMAQGQRVCIPQSVVPLRSLGVPSSFSLHPGSLACLPAIPRPFLVFEEHAGTGAMIVAETQGVPAPAEETWANRFKTAKEPPLAASLGLAAAVPLGLILQRKQLSRDSLPSLLQDQGGSTFQGFSAVQGATRLKVSLYLRAFRYFPADMLENKFECTRVHRASADFDVP